MAPEYCNSDDGHIIAEHAVKSFSQVTVLTRSDAFVDRQENFTSRVASKNVLV